MEVHCSFYCYSLPAMQHPYSRYFVLSLLWLTSLALPAGAQSILPATIDSLQKALRVSKPDTSRVALWLQLGEHHLYKPEELQADMDTALAYAKKAEGLSRSLEFAEGYHGSQLLMARIFLEGKRVDQANALLQKTQPGKPRIALLLLFGQHYLKRPKELPADLDSAEGYVRQAMDLSAALNDPAGQVEGLALLGNIYQEKGSPHQARVYLREAFPFLEQLKDRTLAVRLWYLVGEGFSHTKEDMPEKIDCYEQALSLYRQLGNKQQEAVTLKEIADLHLQQGKLGQSLGELIEVLRIQKTIRYEKIHFTYDLLGAVYEIMGNYEKALPNMLAAIENARAARDTSHIEFLYLRLGNLYAEIGEHQKALQVFRGILVRQQLNGDKMYLIIYCAGKINRQLLNLNRPEEALAFLRRTIKRHPPNEPDVQLEAFFFLGETYLFLKSYALAEAHLRKALKIFDANNYNNNNTNNDRRTVWIHQHLVRLYRETGQYQKARSSLSQAFELAKQRKFIKELSETHLQAFKLDSLQGNFPAAIAHYQRYKALTDSIFNEKKSNQLISFQVQYDTQKKEQDLQLKRQDIKLKAKSIALLTQQSKAQQASIGQRRTERNALMGGTALLLSIIALGYNRYRLKQRSNQQLQAQQLTLQAQQQQLKASAAKLRMIFDKAPVGIYVVRGQDLIFEFVNERYQEMTDRVGISLVGKPLGFGMSVPVPQLPEAMRMMHEVMHTGQPKALSEFQLNLPRNGRLESGYYNLVIEPLYEEDSRCTGAFVTVADVTHSVVSRHRVEANEAYLQRVFRHAPVGIAIYQGPDFMIELANPVICALCNRPEDQLLGKPLREALPETAELVAKMLINVRQTKQPFVTIDMPWVINLDGELETIYADLVCEPLLDDDGQVNRIIQTITDVTERVLARRHVEEMLDRERELNELKSNFVTLASHEFRTPMATILSSADLIERYNGADDGAKRDRHVQRIKLAVLGLTGQLDDFLSLSQMEQKALYSHPHPMDIVSFCEEVIEDVRGVKKPGQRLDYQHLAGEPAISIDGQLLKTILINLIINASKYSADEKEIALTTAVQNEQLLITVKDEGIGIPDSDKDKLFINFFRASNVTHIQGTGLGLYVVKRYVDLLGGRITFTSQLHAGTVFTLQLPLLPLTLSV